MVWQPQPAAAAGGVGPESSLCLSIFLDDDEEEEDEYLQRSWRVCLNGWRNAPSELLREHLGSIPWVLLQSRKNPHQGSGMASSFSSSSPIHSSSKMPEMATSARDLRREQNSLFNLAGRECELSGTVDDLSTRAQPSVLGLLWKAQAGLLQPWEPLGAQLGH